ncbi:MAG: PfkB family carbohydrate kinase [Candidatus Nitrosotenuis sp.]|uniref:Putative pfkB family carbohydrate kinase n=1 Tax=Candidatus Nitrosotenuis uzonensis TaxID=1407055 RepID=A0A812EY49_9ARCH|nr:PfkB family carbohydrate kinase [Candidatus Nitrosotenuis uzonensis]CAE6498864.1 putative pfkB family carbohydrate kinase [Candidatus Nitrosotenuis uzonensis]
MRLGIFSHCTVDEIRIDDSVYDLAGGPAFYCSLAARQFGFDIALCTRFGHDYKYVDIFEKNKIKLIDAQSQGQTTKFVLHINNDERTLWLKNACDEIQYHKLDTDGVLVSPVFSEVSIGTFAKLKKDTDNLFLDPQGFLRRVDSEGRIHFEMTKIDLSGISVLKADPNEVYHLTGKKGIEGALEIHKKVKHVLYTNKRNVSMLYKNKEYSLQLPNMEIYDTVGIGDIFTATFCCTLLKEKDPLWALSFAGGAAQAALESKMVGLEKIPPKAATEANGAYFYNTLKFRDV